MNKLFLDVLKNKELVDGYQIEDSIAIKYSLKQGNISPFTRLTVENLFPEVASMTEEAGQKDERLEKIKKK
jgi:hypothetical protein